MGNFLGWLGLNGASRKVAVEQASQELHGAVDEANTAHEKRKQQLADDTVTTHALQVASAALALAAVNRGKDTQ